MSCLQEIENVFISLRNSKKDAIAALHKFVFESEGDRLNRRRLREFAGFHFNDDDEEYVKKAKYVKENLNANDLVSICNVLGLAYKEDDLTKHIFKNLQRGKLLAFSKDVDDNDGDDDDDDEELYSFKDEEESNRQRNIGRCDASSAKNLSNNDLPKFEEKEFKHTAATTTATRFAMSFRDIEDSLRPFDGTNSFPIRAWLEEFEETSGVLYWDEFQKFVFAKKSLKGLAKLFISSEKGITNYRKLKEVLLEEFDSSTNSAQLHKMLIDCKMGKDDNVQEYYLKMKELAARGNIDESSLIQYIIDGINDLDINKMILYGSKNLKDFKEKLKYYEIMSKNNKKKFELRKNEKVVHKVGQKLEIKCFNCGGNGHKSVNCKDKSRGTKCFQCDNFGHIAKNCTLKKNDSNVRYLFKKEDDMMEIKIDIGGMKMLAFLDTGCAVNAITEQIYLTLPNKPDLVESNFYMVGFGKNRYENKVRPIGNFNYLITIEDEPFDLTFHVVPTDSIDVDVVLGKKFCLSADIRITPRGVQIRKFNESIEESQYIYKINIVDEHSLDIEEAASSNAKKCVTEMIKSYEPLKTKTTNVEMKIILKDDSPIYCAPRRLPIQERSIVDNQVEQWLNEGIIEHSESEFCSPVVLVKKQDGTPRLCIDYRKINKVIVKDRFPLPLIEDQLDRLQGAKVFTTIDLKNGFFHVSVEKSSRKYTSFVTHSGQYQFRKVPFGLSNSPSVFQRHVNAIFRDLSRRGIAIPYIDDIIIPAKDENEAIEFLQIVLKLCQEYGLELSLKKCHFLKKRIQFLGYIIENETITPSPNKIEALVKYPIPRNIKQVESFLGLAGYFRKFIPNFSVIAKPLTDLKKKNQKFDINEEQLNSFNKLKNIMCQKPILNIYNPSYETEVHTDASVEGYGAVLLQRSPDDNCLHPIYYMSRKTTDQEKKYSSYELEILAVIEALKKFKIYLLGTYFKLVTDCNAFTKTLEKRDLCTRVARWILLLQEYNYTVEHRPGNQMKHVDALSRCPMMMITAEDSVIGKIKRSQIQDEDLQTIREILKNKESYNDYFLKGDILYKLVDDNELIVVPKAIHRDVIRIAHDRGHFGVKKTKELICRDYFIPKLDDKIKHHINNCVPCIIINRKKGKQEGELNSLPKDDIPLRTYHIDFLGPLETTNKQYNHIFAVIDAFTKFCWLYPTKSTTAKDAITRLESQAVIFGNPAQIISGRGSAFTSEDFHQYCEEKNIKHIKITTGLPRANGQIERLLGIIAPVLAKLSAEDPTKWFKFVGKVQQVINSTYCRSINTTPFEVLMGAKMRTSEDIRIKELIEEAMIADFNERRSEMRKEAKQQILKVQKENRHTYNLRRKPAKQYKINDLVAIKRTQLGGGLKLKPKFLGPYRVVKVKPHNTYDVVKESDSEGPKLTSTCSEFMKPWSEDGYFQDEIFEDEFEANRLQDGRDVGEREFQN